MKKLFLAFGFFLAFSMAFAQSNTLGEESESPRDTVFYPVESARLAIVPFKPKMYMSKIDKEVGEYNGLNYQEVRGYFRLGLDNALFLAAKDNYSVLRMHADDPEVNQDLHYFYKATGYEYRDVPVEEPEPETTIGKKYAALKTKFQKHEEPEGPNTRMEKGEIVQKPTSGEKFMAVKVVNENFFEMLNEKYEIGLYLIVTELDLKHARGVEWTQYANDDYPREIKVHFSILNKDLEEVYAGIAVRQFSSRENDIKEIIKNHFPPMAEEIMKKLPVLMVEQSEELLAE